MIQGFQNNQQLPANGIFAAAPRRIAVPPAPTLLELQSSVLSAIKRGQARIELSNENLFHRSTRIDVFRIMRLSLHELQSVRQTLLGADPNGQVWLFGSRADDSRRGGDIDLYLEASQPVSLKASLALEYRLTAMCGSKVDLLIRNPGQAEQPIHVIAKRGVPL